VRSLCNTARTADGQLDDLDKEARSSCVFVVENEPLVRVLTEPDVVRLSVQQRSLENLALRSVMAHPVVTLRESAFTDLFFAINLLQHHHIRHLPIVDEHDRCGKSPLVRLRLGWRSVLRSLAGRLLFVCDR